MNGLSALPTLSTPKYFGWISNISKTFVLCGALSLFFLINNVAIASLKLSPWAENISASWAISELPNGDIAATKRAGGLLVLRDGKVVSDIELTPEDFYPGGQGGLLDIAVQPGAPEQSDSPWLYLSYSGGTDDANYLNVVRFKLVNNQVTELEQVYKVEPSKSTPVHYSGRMLFLNDGSLLVASGDGFDYREQAQVKDSHLGKVIRINPQGNPPSNNPFFDNNATLASSVFTLGHRNLQGLVQLPNGDIIAHEHGPDGGDEINRLVAGNNYGWPVVTKGMDYIGSTISPFEEYPGMQDPLVNWTPSIAPSGMDYVERSANAQLNDKLVITALKTRRVYLVSSDLTNPTISELFADQSIRWRDVLVTSAGDVLLLQDGENATIYKIDY